VIKMTLIKSNVLSKAIIMPPIGSWLAKHQGSALCALIALTLLTCHGHAQTAASQTQAAPTQTSAAGRPNESTPSLAQLQQMIDKGDPADALKGLATLAAQNPVPPGVKLTQGKALYALNRLIDADSTFAEALAEDPHDAEAAQMRGLTLFRLGRANDAIPLLTQAQAWTAQTRVDPSYVLALCYLDTRRYDDARRAFATQYGFPPDSAPAYLLASRMLFRHEYIPIAQQFAQKAIELDPRLPLAHALLGEIALSGNHTDVAIAEFEKERSSNPLDGGIYDRLGDAYSRAGEYQKALQALQQAVVLEPNVTAPFILLGKVLLREQLPSNALMYLERAEAMDPNNYMTHSLLGQAYHSLGRTADASRENHTVETLQAASEPKLQNVQ
jgi:predicted Zn-dependent protease